VDFYIHPAFKEDSDLSEIKFKIGDVTPSIKLNESSEKVINLIRNNPNITIPELAGSIGISTRAIEKIIGNLKHASIIERKGSRKTGYWEIKSSG
jgi:predicted HTH transcriptional regulator